MARRRPQPRKPEEFRGLALEKVIEREEALHNPKQSWTCHSCGYAPNNDQLSATCQNCGRDFLGRPGGTPPTKLNREVRPGLRDDVP